MDYKRLLIKYIEHVGQCEGITFIASESNVKFSEEELVELGNLSELYNEE